MDWLFSEEASIFMQFCWQNFASLLFCKILFSCSFETPFNLSLRSFPCFAVRNSIYCAQWHNKKITLISS